MAIVKARSMHSISSRTFASRGRCPSGAVNRLRSSVASRAGATAFHYQTLNVGMTEPIKDGIGIMDITPLIRDEIEKLQLEEGFVNVLSGARSPRVLMMVDGCVPGAYAPRTPLTGVRFAQVDKGWPAPQGVRVQLCSLATPPGNGPPFKVGRAQVWTKGDRPFVPGLLPPGPPIKSERGPPRLAWGCRRLACTRSPTIHKHLLSHGLAQQRTTIPQFTQGQAGTWHLAAKLSRIFRRFANAQQGIVSLFWPRPPNRGPRVQLLSRFLL
eukprot:gene7274-387_t